MEIEEMEQRERAYLPQMEKMTPHGFPPQWHFLRMWPAREGCRAEDAAWLELVTGELDLDNDLLCSAKAQGIAGVRNSTVECHFEVVGLLPNKMKVSNIEWCSDGRVCSVAGANVTVTWLPWNPRTGFRSELSFIIREQRLITNYLG